MTQALQTTRFSPEQLKLITDTVARGATPDELKLFLYRCQSMGFDPLKSGQIHFVKYGTGPGTIVVGIDGLRTRAARSGKLNGIKRGTVRDEKGQAIGGWAEVYRTDWAHPARSEVALDEYSTGKGPWAKMPTTMIQKVAESAALRMAFPDDLGDLYTNDEMDQAREQARNALPKIVPEQPSSEDGFVDESYRIPFGKYAKRSLEEVGPEDLRGYVVWLEGKAEKDGKPIQGQVADFIERATAYIIAFENGSGSEPGQEG